MQCQSIDKHSLHAQGSKDRGSPSLTRAVLRNAPVCACTDRSHFQQLLFAPLHRNCLGRGFALLSEFELQLRPNTWFDMRAGVGASCSELYLCSDACNRTPLHQLHPDLGTHTIFPCPPPPIDPTSANTRSAARSSLPWRDRNATASSCKGGDHW